MSNTPKLRFPEFSGEWEEKTFGDILSLNMVPVPKPDTEYERLGIFCHNKGTFHEHITDPSYIALDTLYKVHKNNFIVNITFAWEHAIAITTQNDEDALVTFRFLMFSFNKGYYHQFFKYAFSKEKFRYDLNVASPGGAGRNRVLNQKQLNNINLIVPSISEQEKIADFLSNVDSIITAETKILNALQKKKKALMQKLFSRQLRFKSDDGTDFLEWEEKKLGECVEILDSRRKPIESKERANRKGEYPYYGASGIIDYIDDYLFEGESILLGEDEANIINRNSRLAFIATGKYWVNNHAHIMKANTDNLNYFICEYLESLDYSKICAGSAQPKLTQDVIRNLTIKAPCKAEQQKIADCLSSMDSLIQNQQKVVTTWQQRKKALLQQMFI